MPGRPEDEMRRQGFEVDENGELVIRPLTRWRIARVAESVVFLALQYSDSSADLRTGKRSLQLGLTPQQSLELADALIRQTHAILADKPSIQKPN
jgi:hypothetical protein